MSGYDSRYLSPASNFGVDGILHPQSPALLPCDTQSAQDELGCADTLSFRQHCFQQPHL